jgi:hypothetical protein
MDEPLPPPSPSPGYSPQARSTSRAGPVIVIAAVAALLIVVLIAAAVVVLWSGAPQAGALAPGPIDESTAVTAGRGIVVFSDDFRNASSGWTTETLPSGTTFSYKAAGYVIVAKGTVDHFATAPYETPLQQMAISVAATQSTDAPIGAGYGVSCWRGAGKSELRYDFIVSTAGDWQVSRQDGGIPTQPAILKRGKASATLGSKPLTVVGMCATLADLHSTRLVLFAGQQKLADITDRATAMPDAGWLSDLMVTSEDLHPSIVTATRFEVRDLAR